MLIYKMMKAKYEGVISLISSVEYLEHMHPCCSNSRCYDTVELLFSLNSWVTHEFTSPRPFNKAIQQISYTRNLPANRQNF